VTRAALAGWRAATHAALLAGAATLALPAAAASSDPGFAPPRDQPLVLSRTVVRELRDGAAIVATRRYRVTFHPRGDGWLVDGTLIASEIDVPPALSAIAAFERGRPDDGLFPMTLDHTGRIVSQSPSLGNERAALSSALGAARKLTGTSQAAAPGGFLAQIGAAAASPSGGQTAWPEALFLPHGLSGNSEQTFQLPDGSDGSVLVLLESEAATAQATMGRARRTVVTKVAGTRRVAREEWTLGPIAAPIKP
jgi:hypothetical protein